MSSIHNGAQFVVIEMEPVYVPYAVPIYVPYASFKHGLALDFPEEAITAMTPESVERVVTLKGELEELMTSLEKRRGEMCRVLAVHGGDRVYGARSDRLPPESEEEEKEKGATGRKGRRQRAALAKWERQGIFHEVFKAWQAVADRAWRAEKTASWAASKAAVSDKAAGKTKEGGGA